MVWMLAFFIVGTHDPAPGQPITRWQYLYECRIRATEVQSHATQYGPDIYGVCVPEPR